MIGKDISLSHNNSSSYDYIIVGSGSAGSVLATELAALQAGSILLIEEGTRGGHYQSRRPALYPHLFQNPTMSHVDRSCPQTGLAGRSMMLPSGKGMGGSSLLNAMILSPPHRSDLVRWHQLLGPAWDANAMLELLCELYQRIASHVDREPELHPLSREILQSMASTASPSRLFPYARFVKRGRRESIWRAISHADSSRSISVVRGHKVERIAISNDRAVGVTLSSSPLVTPETLRANKAVILCAGALKTPTILMKSGIGPEDNITLHRSLEVDAPLVGKNLSDHLVFPVTFKGSRESLPSQFCDEMNRLWIEQGTGPLASNIAEIGAFGWRDRLDGYSLSPPVQSDLNKSQSPCFQWHITPSHYLEYPGKVPATHAVSVGITPLHPRSRGSIDWLEDGSFRIDPGYLSDRADEDELKSIVTWTRQWINACPWKSILEEELIPGLRRQTDDSVLAIIKRLSSTIYHYLGTSAMGNSIESVCDPEFRVRGCEGLYVCDGSSLPDQVSGNPQVTVMLIALKLARQIAKQS